MKIRVELEDWRDGDKTVVTREVSWPEDGDDQIDLHSMVGDSVAKVDRRHEHLTEVTTRIAALAVDIHTTR